MKTQLLQDIGESHSDEAPPAAPAAASVAAPTAPVSAPVPAAEAASVPVLSKVWKSRPASPVPVAPVAPEPAPPQPPDAAPPQVWRQAPVRAEPVQAPPAMALEPHPAPAPAPAPPLSPPSPPPPPPPPASEAPLFTIEIPAAQPQAAPLPQEESIPRPGVPVAPTWAARWGRGAGTLGACLAGAALLGGGGYWLYRESRIENTLAIVASSAEPARQSVRPAVAYVPVAEPEPPPMVLLKETAPASIAPVAAPAPALPTKLTTPTTPPTASRDAAMIRKPAADPAAPKPAVRSKPAAQAAPPPSVRSARRRDDGNDAPLRRPERTQTQAAKAPAAKAPAKGAPKTAAKGVAKAPAKAAPKAASKTASKAAPKAASKAAPKAAPKTVSRAPARSASASGYDMAETLRQCRSAGYDNVRCIERSCKATKFGLACRG